MKSLFLLIIFSTATILLSQPPAVAPTPSAPSSPPAAPGAAAGVESDIRDIRGPIHIPYPWLWAIYVAAGLAGAGLAYGIYRLLKKSAKARIKLPYEIALERLEGARALMTPDQSEAFSVEVSRAVRSYIETVFHVHAPRKTTEEFLHDLLSNSSSILSRHAHLLEDFLQHCDLAKFARWSLSKEEMEAMLESGKRFVTETHQPQSAPAGKTGEGPTIRGAKVAA
jgi:hypothetical protein